MQTFKFRLLVMVLAAVLLAPGLAHAGRVTLAWDQSTDPVTGYVVYYGTAPGVYTGAVNVGNQTSAVLLGLANGVTYYFAVKAYVGALYSGPSNQVSGAPINLAPSITNPGNVTTRAGSLTLPITASDPDLDVLTYSAAGLPPGLAINTGTGVVGGNVTAGTYVVTVTVNDGAAQASATFTMTVTADSPPVLTNPGNQTSAEGAVVSLQLVATDPDGDALSYSATALPGGLSVSATTGVISGTLSSTSAGSYTVTATASDASLASSKSFTWTVTNTNRAPTLTPISNRTDAEGASISLQLVATDPDGDALTYGASGLPGGLSVSATTGVISGTLSSTSAGSYTVTATASDGSLASSKSFTWTVTNTNRAPTLTALSNRTDAEGASISLPLSATDPDGNALTYSATGLPGGLSVSATTGVISGTLSFTSAGSYAVTATASDGSLSSSKSFTWTVTNTNRAPTLTALSNRTDAEGASISLPLSATDPDGNVLTYSATGLPAGLSVNATTGVILGTLSFTSAGSYTVTATASDGSLSSSKSFAWTVTNTNRAPTLMAPPNRTNAEGASVSLSLVASDPDGDVVTYSAAGLPAGVGVNATTGLVSGTLAATSAGGYAVTVMASDGTLSTSQTFTWTVSGALADLVVDFGATSGVWLRNGKTAAWSQLETMSAKSIATGDLDGNGIDEVIIDFGAPVGIWVWANNASWYQLHASTATRMVTGDLDGNGKAEVLIDFPGLGIWVWANNASWLQLHPSNANNMMTADLDGNGQREAIIDFPGSGLWVWRNNASWFQLHALNSRLMTVGDFDGNGQADLVVDFAGVGIWAYTNNSSWSQVHPSEASHLAGRGDVDGDGKSDLIVDFGAGGIWMMASGNWSQLHALTATNILTADLDRNGKAEVIANFGAAGLWVYLNNTTWVQLHSASPGAIAAGHIFAPGH